MAKAKPKQTDTEPCAACGGRGVIAWGTDDVTCDACGGKGTVALPKPDSKDRS